MLNFQSCKFLSEKIAKTSILPNCQVPNSFFGITVNFIIQKQVWEKSFFGITVNFIIQKQLWEKKTLFITLLSA
jgi:hypothetical protein